MAGIKSTACDDHLESQSPAHLVRRPVGGENLLSDLLLWVHERVVNQVSVYVDHLGGRY